MPHIFKRIVEAILRAEARAVLKKYKPKIILITGSIGKTSTKDAVFAVLSKFHHVRKSEKSYNSEIGIPLSILGLESGWRNPFLWGKNFAKGIWLLISKQKYPEWLVLEVGARRPGDIRKSAGWFHADIIILTTIGSTPPHIEFYESLEQLVEEKASIIKSLKPGGTVMIAADDPVVFDIKNKITERVIAFGETKGLDVYATNLAIHYAHPSGAPEGLSFKAHIGVEVFPVAMHWVFGKNHMTAALAALSVAYGMDYDLEKAAAALTAFEVSNGRLRLIEGVAGSFIIDDTYNSSPAAMEAALDTLEKIKVGGKKIAVLGDMLELGKFTEEAHRRVGEQVAPIADIVITVGIRAKFVWAAAKEKGAFTKETLIHVPTSQEAGDVVRKLLQKGDVALIKGSQTMRMERVVKACMLHVDLAPRLLVRQEKEWLKR